MKAILVTGIGGVVGQGILRNLRAMQLGAPIVGTNTVRVSGGNHLCDEVVQVPFAHEPEYLPAVRALVERHDVKLVVPSTDYESLYLSKHATTVPAMLATSPFPVVAFCIDKYENFIAFERAGLPFAASCLPSSYAGQFPRTVVKPREGRGSRSIHVDPPAPTEFADDFVVQEYLDGPELTTTFYVRQSGELHGIITFERELEQGNTARCEVVDRYDGEMGELVRRMVEHFPFRGSCNLQSRVTSRGIVPFEINCRISGTNSVRAQFGFNDVAYTVQELYQGRRPEAPAVTKGCAVRIMMDVIYPERRLADVTNRNDPHRIF
jgi:carbamoyl-phosphate synthase large subunit